MYNRDSKIMRKLLGKGASEVSTGNVYINNASSPSYRPSQSQNAVYAAGAPISCLDVALDRRAVVLASRHVLKTILPADPDGFRFAFTDGLDLRAVIVAQRTSGSKASLVADQLNIRDVKWHGSSIFTACANGRIVNYDLVRIGEGGADALDCVQIQEDSRQVNTLDVNPHLRNWLLSGSQDGMARVFDASAPWHKKSGVLTFRQRFVPLRCIDSVRQVQWSPRVGHEMACCTEAGVVMKWDVRQPSRPLLRINAHDKACTSIAWHPDGIHLMSAGWDSKLHVWDLGGSADRRQKPKWTINTPAPVASSAWRPGLWSASAQSRRAAQVAVSYDETGSMRFGTPLVHVWDLARPTLPYKEIERFQRSPAALSWPDRDMLWTVGQDGMFHQCDLAFAPKVVDRLSTSASAFSPRGEALMFLDERPPVPRPRPAVAHQTETTSRKPYGPTYQSQVLSLSRSDSEEDVVGSFLGPRRRLHHQRRLSGRSAFVSTTPPSGATTEDGDAVLSLEQAIKLTGTFRSQQAMASGPIPAAKTVGMYQHLSRLYLETVRRELPLAPDGPPLVQRVGAILEQYAKGAEAASLFRLAQTWRVLAYAMGLLLRRRAQYHLEARVAHFQKVKVEGKTSSDRLGPGSSYNTSSAVDEGEATAFGSARPSRFESLSALGKSLISEEIESTSNVPTPVARPADAGGTVQRPDELYRHGKPPTPVMEPDVLHLGPSARGSFIDRDVRPAVLANSHDSGHSHWSSTEGYDFYDTETLSLAIGTAVSHSPQDPTPQGDEQEGADGRATARRGDSGESYGQLFSISEGTKQSAQIAVKESNLGAAEDNDGDVSGAVFESRIRGHELQQQAPPHRPHGMPNAGSTEDVFMISQTTVSTDETQTSQQSFHSQTDSDIQQEEARAPVNLRPPVTTVQASSPAKAAPLFQFDPRPHIIASDYLPWPSDPPGLVSNVGKPRPSLTPPSPLDPYTLIKRTLEFESRTSALNASAIVLLLKPLVPQSVVGYHQANAILLQQHSRLMKMGLFTEATLLRKLCLRGWPEGLAEWGENYAAIFSPAQQGVKVGFSCSSCHRPREIHPGAGESAIWQCERCRSVMGPCGVCGHREPQLASQKPVEIVEAWGHGGSIDDGLSNWWYCLGCAHGGHASCLQTWHAPVSCNSPDAPSEAPPKYSDGCCPLDGCGHACLPGRYRQETAAARADDVARAAVETSHNRRRTSAGSPRSSPRPAGGEQSVRSDANEVPQSRAVGMVRERLRRGGAPAGGILSSSPGRTTTVERDRERRKSVKFARKDE